VSNTILLPSNYADQFRSHHVPWGFNGLGEMVYARTYLREGEDWPDATLRTVNGAQMIGSNLSTDEMETLYDHILNLRGSVSGRGLWQLGTPLVEEIGSASLYNCVGSPSTDFAFLMEMLMLGCGVGYSVERSDVYEFPKIRKLSSKITHENTPDADHIVPDRREGWSQLVAKIVESYTVTGQGFSYSSILLRSAGAPLKRFGGTSSGPVVLVNGIADIIAIFESRVGKKLRSIDVLDINTIIGRIVVAGNARRSAQLSSGDPDDHLYANAKNWSKGLIPADRSNVNVSITADGFDQIPAWWFRSGWKGEGEIHGLLNRDLARTTGRTGERVDDHRVVCTNPCGEIFLEPYEVCNLAEIFLPNITNYEQFREVSSVLYKVQKATALYPHHDPRTQAVLNRNMRLGQSVSGIAQATEEQLSWLDQGYRDLKALDVAHSKKLGVKPSIKLTAIQPSGTKSLGPGITPGAHSGHDRFYIRRVQFAANNPLVKVARERGYNVVPSVKLDGVEDHNQLLVEFPCESPPSARLIGDTSAVEQLERVSFLQRVWADNAVSVTVSFRAGEEGEIKDWLAENYTDGVKSVSFLRHEDHNFERPPYETITEEEYHQLASKLDLSVPIVTTSKTTDLGDDCVGGACPVR
jgi:ribonucleoside-triphosphate reductase